MNNINMSNLIKGFYETDLAAFNVKVLWVKDFDEIPIGIV